MGGLNRKHFILVHAATEESNNWRTICDKGVLEENSRDFDLNISGN